jgi:hypothetical protein
MIVAIFSGGITFSDGYHGFCSSGYPRTRCGRLLEKGMGMEVPDGTSQEDIHRLIQLHMRSIFGEVNLILDGKISFWNKETDKLIM